MVTTGWAAIEWLQKLIDILQADIPNVPDRLSQIATLVVAELPTQLGLNSTLPTPTSVLALLPGK